MARNLRDIYAGVDKKDTNRRSNDFYPTPPLATYILHKYADVPKRVIEPCAGRGNISVELERNGYEVRSFDLEQYEESLTTVCVGQDVMQLEKQEGFEGAVTNPPYHKDLPRKIAEKLVSEYDFVAMFVRLTFLEGKKRKKLFTDNTPSDIIFMSDRIRFIESTTEPIERKDQLGGMIAYCWVVWNKNAPHHNTKCSWVCLDDEYDEWREKYNKRTT